VDLNPEKKEKEAAAAKRGTTTELPRAEKKSTRPHRNTVESTQAMTKKGLANRGVGDN